MKQTFGPLVVGMDGWVEGGEVAHVPSPYFDARPAHTPIDLLVIHSISLPPGEFGTGEPLRLFLGTLDLGAHPFYATLVGLQVSAHFLIERSGRITQFVSCAERAWHAGVSTFEGRARCNDFSLGIELEGCDTVAFMPAQYEALVHLTQTLAAAYPLRAVCGHCHIAPERKTDPGPCFEWARYERALQLPRLSFPVSA
ncbi:MAG TPA: 1,6-anhydro-N-acetylmuramyl-L-alanine amidase AmpD [Burkholderiaceae bacterium]|nr:1,6-anhydro-N-acetylmuramyl-L-alanine amidase AmpD [Burkholderiaceae bacterium]